MRQSVCWLLLQCGISPSQAFPGRSRRPSGVFRASRGLDPATDPPKPAVLFVPRHPAPPAPHDSPVILAKPSIQPVQPVQPWHMQPTSFISSTISWLSHFLDAAFGLCIAFPTRSDAPRRAAQPARLRARRWPLAAALPLLAVSHGQRRRDPNNPTPDPDPPPKRPHAASRSRTRQNTHLGCMPDCVPRQRA